MKSLARAWAWLRRLSGDDAYEQFVAHLRLAHPETPPPTQAQFCREREEEKWNGVKRCC